MDTVRVLCGYCVDTVGARNPFDLRCALRHSQWAAGPRASIDGRVGHDGASLLALRRVAPNVVAHTCATQRAVVPPGFLYQNPLVYFAAIRGFGPRPTSC